MSSTSSVQPDLQHQDGEDISDNDQSSCNEQKVTDGGLWIDFRPVDVEKPIQQQGR